MRRIVLVLLLILGASAGASSRSGLLKEFRLHRCQGTACVTATGLTAFLSMSQDYISAADVKVTALPGQGAKPLTIDCAGFQYDLRSELLICDNQERGSVSLTIDSKMTVRKYPVAR